MAAAKEEDGKPCDYKCMLQNRCLPRTLFRLANGEIFNFKSWTNPVVCRDEVLLLDPYIIINFLIIPILLQAARCHRSAV